MFSERDRMYADKLIQKLFGKDRLFHQSGGRCGSGRHYSYILDLSPDPYAIHEEDNGQYRVTYYPGDGISFEELGKFGRFSDAVEKIAYHMFKSKLMLERAIICEAMEMPDPGNGVCYDG